MFVGINDHVELGLARLPESMRLPNITTLLTTWLEPLQEVEDALVQLRDGQHPAGAIGVQLDVLGRVVRWPRRGMADNAYRPMLQVANRVNKNSCWVDDILEIFAIIEPELGVRYQLSPPAEYILRFNDVAETPREVIDTVIQRTRPVGSRVHFEYLDVPPASTWRLKRHDTPDGETGAQLRSWFDEDAGARGRRAWSNAPT